MLDSAEREAFWRPPRLVRRRATRLPKLLCDDPVAQAAFGRGVAVGSKVLSMTARRQLVALLPFRLANAVLGCKWPLLV
jgi:hypothetical protein